MTRKNLFRLRIIAGIVVFCALGGGYIFLDQSGVLEQLLDVRRFEALIESLGSAGPVLVVGLMTVAIVMSPIPSAPIALASGAAYGHLWGTLYVAVGSEAGALLAFGLARLLGYGAVQSMLKAKSSSTFLNRFLQSQNALTAIVFASRLMPFLSFDVISYAAGLSPLKTWRFAVATLLGIVPASFVLAHFGDTLATGGARELFLTSLILGLITVAPIAWKFTPARYPARVTRFLKLKKAGGSLLHSRPNGAVNSAKQRR